MNEHYLQWIWSLKRLPFHLIFTTDGSPIEIKKVGSWNFDSGPDFFNGEIVLDGVTLVGNIEIHVKSSDWVVHKHHFDESYANVILHVVYEHDMVIELNGQPISTIQLKEFIDWNHFHQFQATIHKNHSLPCAYFIDKVPSAIIWDEVAKASWSRLISKASIQTPVLSNTTIQEVLFGFLARSFGMKTNRLAFEELTNRLPIMKVIQSNYKQKMALCFGTAGFLNQPEDAFVALVEEWNFQKKRLGILESNRLIWKYKGCRPKGFPEVRLQQFVEFIDEFTWDPEFWELPVKNIYRELVRMLMKSEGKNTGSIVPVQTMSKSTANIIVINGIAPFLFWLNRINRQASYAQKAIELLELIAPERHKMIEEWHALGVVPRSAFDSQGLLELKRNKCVAKQCLNCKIGRYGLKEI